MSAFKVKDRWIKIDVDLEPEVDKVVEKST